MKTKRTNSNKLLSGRLWLTIIVGICFLAFSLTVCHIMWLKQDSLSSTEISSIVNLLLLVISNVMTFYFTKNRNEETQKKEISEVEVENEESQKE